MLSFRVALLGTAIIITAPIGYCTIRNELERRDSIPQKLHQGWFFTEGACNRFLSYQGAYAISLTDETINDIRKLGLNFFFDLNDERSRKNGSYFRGEWKSTPIPGSFHTEGVVPNLHCGKEYALFWPKGIVEALDRPGSYYLGTGGRNFYVIPDLGLVVVSGSDR